MKVGQTSMLVLPVDANVGGNVYVPPTACPRSDYSAVYTAARVGPTESSRTNVFATARPASGMRQNSFLAEVR
jgi:hypothetical protein